MVNAGCDETVDLGLGRSHAACEQRGLRQGACGYLITDWGDNGHWQTLPVSYLGFAGGAALCSVKYSIPNKLISHL